MVILTDLFSDEKYTCLEKDELIKVLCNTNLEELLLLSGETIEEKADTLIDYYKLGE